MFKKQVFQVLAKINKWVLPRVSKRNLNKLSTFDRAVVAYRYWVLINALD